MPYYVGPLICDRCKKEINEIARSQSGDDRIYCRKCWPLIQREAALKEENAVINPIVGSASIGSVSEEIMKEMEAV